MMDEARFSGQQGRQKGAALVISVVLLMVCLMLGVSSMQSSLLDERLAGNHLASIRAQMAAEVGASAGVDEAINAGCNKPPISLLGEGELPVFHDDSDIQGFYEANNITGHKGYVFGDLEENDLLVLSRGESGAAIRFSKVTVSAPCDGEPIFMDGMVSGVEPEENIMIEAWEGVY